MHHVGTYNGNPLGMAAARASLLEVLTPEAYEHLERLGERMAAGGGRRAPLAASARRAASTRRAPRPAKRVAS